MKDVECKTEVVLKIAKVLEDSGLFQIHNSTDQGYSIVFALRHSDGMDKNSKDYDWTESCLTSLRWNCPRNKKSWVLRQS